MSKIKKISILIVCVLLAAAMILAYFRYQRWQHWPVRFHAELDDFFGKGNWEWLSEETKESSMYTVHYYSEDAVTNLDVPGTYHNWDIGFTNREGDSEVWTMTDHAMKINQSKKGFFSSGRLSAKQALVRELMEISFEVAEDEIMQEILYKILPEKEAACLDVDISYRNGNPPPKMYDTVIRQPWFSVNRINASDYLATELWDYYIRIQAFDYRLEKLTEKERDHVMEQLGRMEKALRDAYRENADYEIYLDEAHKAEYTSEGG